MKNLLIKLIGAAVAAFTVSAGAADVAQIAKDVLPEAAPSTITWKADNGVLYSKNELEHLSRGELAGGKVVAVSKSAKPQNADPVAALTDFNNQLKELNIRLIVVPVPPKAAICPFGNLKPGDAMVCLRPLYDELRKQGIELLDPAELFLNTANCGAYCRTDAHWSPAGIAPVADELAKRIALHGDRQYTVKQSDAKISGDLARSLSPAAPETENVTLDTVQENVFDDASPVLVIGDSHTLIFSTGGDMLAENSGLCEAIAARIGMPVERIGVKGSAATAVRVNLYRKAAKNPEWLKGKKVVIYCFSCREFTESASGWVKVPVMKR
ncbi:MAG: hypothetical protein PHI85_05575 [Victivallaceae bacterium]|nr:hypothetical protein [Victivallaceae bacterium]